MRIVVTGGKGLVGKNTLYALREYGCEAISAGRSSTTAADDSIYFDIHDKSSWPNILAYAPQRLIHCAWEYLDNFNDTRHYLTLFPAHLEFLIWCISRGITDITVSGTCLEYGYVEGELIESMPTNPVIAYAIGKDLLRRALEHYAAQTSATLKWARLFFISGSGGNEKGVFKLIRDAALEKRSTVSLSKGEQRRDYMSAQDAGEFLARFCLQDRIGGPVNCCSGEAVAMREIIERFSVHYPEVHLDFGRIPYRSYEPMAFWGNRTLMNQVLREPLIDISSTRRESYEYSF